MPGEPKITNEAQSETCPLICFPKLSPLASHSVLPFRTGITGTKGFVRSHQGTESGSWMVLSVGAVQELACTECSMVPVIGSELALFPLCFRRRLLPECLMKHVGEILRRGQVGLSIIIFAYSQFALRVLGSFEYRSRVAWDC